MKMIQDDIEKLIPKLIQDINNSGYIHNEIASYDEASLINIQQTLKRKISINNNISNINIVAGVDLAYFKIKEKEYATCVIALIDYSTKELLDYVYEIGEVNCPYIPGCLAFREMPLFIKTHNKLIKEKNIYPDIYMFDGNGTLHPRKMGLATHAGFLLNKPTIGVAKTYFKVNNHEFIMPENEKGAFTPINIDNEICAVAYRSHKDVKPIFISMGNNINMDNAIDITQQMITKISRVPAPTRHADIIANDIRKNIRCNI